MVVGLAQVVDLVSGVRDAVGALPADRGELRVGKRFRDEGVVVHGEHRQGQAAQERAVDVGGQGDALRGDLGVRGAQPQRVAAGGEGGDLRVLGDADAEVQARPARSPVLWFYRTEVQDRRADQDPQPGR